MTDYRERVGKKSSTSAEAGEEIEDNGGKPKIEVNVDQLVSKVLISSISGVATAIAIKAFLGEK